MRSAFLPALLFAAASTSAIAASPVLDRAQLNQLDGLQVGASMAIDHFPDGFGNEASVRFERIEIYARGARVFVADASGEHEVARSARIELIGRSVSGDVQLSLGFDPGVVNLSGVGTASAGTFAVFAERAGNGLRLRAAPMESRLPAGVKPRILSGDDGVPSGRALPSDLAVALTGKQPTGSFRNAIVAVDTDNEFMSARFGNNTTAAASWIADLFAAMNVMYQRDLNVNLLEGNTILRTTTDPYTETDTPADQADLTEFGTYWQTHYASTQRSFAMLLSGKSSSGDSASGIAWIDAYCADQSEGGSYSVEQVFTDPGVDVSFSALIVGHELGHNFGAYHTHCTNITNGSAPTGTNTIDQCYNAETGCYSGPTSCPTTGPGAPAGTVMSYCNLNSCGPDHQNVLQFHPTQINVLNALIAQNTPSCLSTVVDVIFKNDFD